MRSLQGRQDTYGIKTAAACNKQLYENVLTENRKKGLYYSRTFAHNTNLLQLNKPTEASFRTYYYHEEGNIRNSG